MPLELTRTSTRNSKHSGYTHNSVAGSPERAAARLITGTSRRDHITQVLRQLHWLPFRHRVEFKLVVLVIKAMHGLAVLVVVLSSPNNRQ